MIITFFIPPMKTVLTFLVASACCVSAFGEISHLVLRSQGDGAVFRSSEQKAEPVKRASFLPQGQRITVRPRSGIETIGAGYQFRFGSDTSFTLDGKAIGIHDGSIMVLSRKMGSELIIKSPETQVVLAGIGTCMMEVEPNGGLKLLCVLGRILVGSGQPKTRLELLPGELVFAKPGARGLGDRINVNLETVVTSSYLLSGFPNADSLKNSLRNVVRAQKTSIGRTYRAEVGQAKGSNTFEILPIPDAVPEDDFPSAPKPPSYKIPNADPLSELLGRSPKRLPEKEDLRIRQGQAPRPFPTRLLRPE